MVVLLESLPELASFVEDLLVEAGEDLSGELVFAELATLAGELLRMSPRDEPTLERLLAALEAVAVAPGIDADAVIGYGFLLNLDEDAAALADAFLGPHTAAIEARFVAGEL